MLEALFRFIDFFLPDSLRENEVEVTSHARLSVAFAFFIGLVSIAFALAYPYIAPQVFVTTSRMAFGLGIAFLVMPWILRATGALGAVGAFLALAPIAILFLVAWNSHGLRTPGLLFLHVPILIGLGIGGRRLGLASAVSATAVLTLFGALELGGLREFPPIEPSPVLPLVILGLGLAMVVGVGWFYESTRVQTLGRLEEALSAAEGANETKREFLASMSHELRTPLNSVIGFSQVVLTKEELSSSGLDMLERVRTSGIHLLNLVNQILDVSKIESGEIELELEVVDVARLAKEVVRELEGQKPREHVELVSELCHDCIGLASDPARLRQVLSNLVVNALKFTRKGSVTVRLSCEGAEPKALEVIDTGVGIPKDKLEEIFEPFVQADTGTSRSFDGSGLGLAICQMLCEAMGYTLEVESEVGVGSTFRIRFS